jgi:hypothetical protein
MIESPIATTTGRVAAEGGLVSVERVAVEHPARKSIPAASTSTEAMARRFTIPKSTPAAYENAARAVIGFTHD